MACYHLSWAILNAARTHSVIWLGMWVMDNHSDDIGHGRRVAMALGNTSHNGRGDRGE